MEQLGRREIMTLREASEYLRIHPITLYRLRKEKKVKSFKVGGQYRFMREHLEGLAKEA